MESSIDEVPTGPLRKLSGKISNYTCTRSAANFVFTDGDRNKLGIVAMAAALAGMGGQAASVSASISGAEEEADYLEFTINGDRIKGWVWRSPFKKGDIVDVAVQWQGDHYEAYGIARPHDNTIALYPHCSRARGRHIKNAIKWWAIWNIAFFGLMALWMLYMGGLKLLLAPELYQIGTPLALFFILPAVSMTRQFMPFVNMAEKVFIALDLPEPRNIDLVKSSSQQRTANDPGEFGTFYFRY